MAKFNLKKQSKRQPARQRYKIQKKIREHNRKVRKEAKKNPKMNKKQPIQVPNICPFKGDILKEVEALREQKKEEQQRKREAARLGKQNKKNEITAAGLEGFVANAEQRNKLHQYPTPKLSDKFHHLDNENSLKQYYKEFKKVIEAADVVLEVVDARDPLGTRCTQVEQAVNEMKGSKRLVLVLNKADLVPRDILDRWLKYLKKSTPTIAFKASTQNQTKKLGQKKYTFAEKTMNVSSCVGADLLMSLLANYCRNKGIKTSIKVGVVGLPNVGKSSIINSLKRSRACNVGATPGITKSMQDVQLDSKIRLLDSPGIVFASGDDNSASLRNAVRVSSLSDPIIPANAILQRVSKQYLMEIYDITDFSSPEEFYSKKASRQGKFRKGGIPDANAAARGLIEDWNSGKIKYYTVPPEDDETSVHVSSTIVTEVAKEFDLNSFETMEVEDLNKIEKEYESEINAFRMDTLGPVTAVEDMDKDEPNYKELLNKDIIVVQPKKDLKIKSETRRKKIDPEMELEGNQKLNQIRKKQFKKDKKQQSRRLKTAHQLSTCMEGFSLDTNNMSAEN